MIRIQTKPSLYRDFALLSVLIVVILLLVSVWIVVRTFQAHSQEIIQKLESEALRIDRALIVEIERSSYLIESIGRQIDTSPEALEASIMRLFTSFSQSKREPTLRFYWVDRSQKLTLTAADGELNKPVDVSDRDYVKRAITAPWQVHIGQPVNSRLSRNWVIPVAMGITDAEERFLGVVALSIDISALNQTISNVIKDPAIDFAITNTAFTMLSEVSAQPHFFDRHFSLSRLMAIDFSQNPSGVYSTASLWDDTSIDAYYELSSEYPYIIFTGYNLNARKGDFDQILIPRLLQIALMTLFLVLTLWTVRKRIIQPVMRLTDETAAVLQRQEFRHDSQNDPFEIERLAEEIGRLAHYIEERLRVEAEMARKNSELMQLKEAAEITNDLKARFFEQVGEALMQPAHTIQEYLESMRNELFGPLGNDKYSEMTEKLIDESQQIIETLKDIQAISKAETGLLALREEPVDLAFVIKKSARLIKEGSMQQELDLILDLDDSLPKVMADELRLKQLMLNVLSTSANDMQASESIRISTHHHHDAIRIELLYRPAMSSERGDQDGAGQPAAFAFPQAGFLKLGHALSEFIIAMHGGTLTTKAMPDQRIKKIITLPKSRIIE